MTNRIAQKVSLRQLSEAFGVHPTTIRAWAYLGDFPAPFKLGGVLRWDLDEVEAFIESQRENYDGESSVPTNNRVTEEINGEN